MFNVKTDKFNIQFTFQHMRDIGEAINVSDVTRCVLRVNGQEFQGIATCSIKDVFVKEQGRKIALRRALESARDKIELPQQVRADIWTRYFERHIPNKDWQISFGPPVNEICATGVLDPEYDKPRVGSDDLTNQA